MGKAAFFVRGLPSHYGNRTVIQADTPIRYHQINIEFHLISESETFRTRTKRIVKGKTSRLYLVYADSTVRAGKVLAEIHRFAVYHIDNH